MIWPITSDGLRTQWCVVGRHELHTDGVVGDTVAKPKADSYMYIFNFNVHRQNLSPSMHLPSTTRP